METPSLWMENPLDDILCGFPRRVNWEAKWQLCERKVFILLSSWQSGTEMLAIRQQFQECAQWCLIASYVTGPPGALLFDRDQRSHWNNHYNSCFVRIAALGIYCTDFLPQLLIQVKYPMHFMVYENTYVTTLSEETSLHWATMHWMTGIRNNERICHLAGNDTSHYQSKRN